MAYLVNLTARAERDLVRLYLQINAEDSDAALKWYRGFKEAILKPGKVQAFAVRQQAAYLPRNVTRAGKQKQVEVLHIRHGARRRFKGPGVE